MKRADAPFLYLAVFSTQLLPAFVPCVFLIIVIMFSLCITSIMPCRGSGGPVPVLSSRSTGFSPGSFHVLIAVDKCLSVYRFVVDRCLSVSQFVVDRCLSVSQFVVDKCLSVSQFVVDRCLTVSQFVVDRCLSFAQFVVDRCFIVSQFEAFDNCFILIQFSVTCAV
jgi:hypothetical protein